MNAPAFVTRFAPSPTGRLHRGHAFSALTAFGAARAAGGRFVLRIEDIDSDRCRVQFVDAILDDLAWLGLEWDGPVVFQSERLETYARALARLRERGLVYRCFRTRAQVLAEIGRAPHGTETPFFGEPLAKTEEASRLEAGEPFAWRLSVRAAEAELGGFSDLEFADAELGRVCADPWRGGDVILGRKDLGVAYHLAVVVDDADAGVTHVIRGEDLRSACHVQRLLQALLALPTPAYLHHRLILQPDGKRLAKRDSAETLHQLRLAGVSAAALRAEMGL